VELNEAVYAHEYRQLIYAFLFSLVEVSNDKGDEQSSGIIGFA
jgi:hypothetical protein